MSQRDKAYKDAMAAKKKALAAGGKGWTEVKTPGKTPVSGSLPNSHTVYDGECLWRISEYSDIYGDPFQWPLIYGANRDEIDRRTPGRLSIN